MIHANFITKKKKQPNYVLKKISSLNTLIEKLKLCKYIWHLPVFSLILLYIYNEQKHQSHNC